MNGELPTVDDFTTDDTRAVFTQWEHSIITSERCREKLKDYGEDVTDEQFAAMCREEADAAQCPDPHANYEPERYESHARDLPPHTEDDRDYPY